MAITGSISPGGGAPQPDPERVATLRYTIVDEPETCAVFGESARAALAELNERSSSETSGAVLEECSLLADRIRSCVADLDPARLEPRRGLAGLFDSRSKRLKTFRAGFLSTAERVVATAADLGGRAGALSARETALDDLWSRTREGITEIDAHIAAARDWLAQDVHPAPAADLEPELNPAPEPVLEAAADAPDETTAPEVVADISPQVEPVDAADAPETSPIDADAEPPPSETVAEGVPDTVEQPEETALAAEAEAEPNLVPETEDVPPTATVELLPHPLSLRLAALESVRAAALARLPVLRATQNADWRTPAALNAVTGAVEAWRADWTEALGLAGKKPRKVRPERARLTASTTALSEAIEAAERELAAARARRSEIRLAA